MLRTTLITFLLLVIAGSAEKKCFAPVVCSEDDSSSPSWQQVYPLPECRANDVALTTQAVPEFLVPGAKGEKGSPGMKGTDGSRVTKGDTGAVGPRGIPGINGMKGDTGAVGPRGPSGHNGTNGDKGTKGEPGISNIPGPRGLQGVAGPPGIVKTSIIDDLKSEVTSLHTKIHVLTAQLGSMWVTRESIRLVNGSSTKSGRVEIQFKGVWGTVCDDIWSWREANVICSMLGFGRASEAPKAAHFGEGIGEIWLDNVNCTGTEANVGLCQHQAWGSHNCRHSEDASVICV